MKKVLLLTAALAMSLLTAWAEDSDPNTEAFYLYYLTSDGSQATQNWKVEQLQKITFEEGKMNVIALDGTTTEIPTANLQNLVFWTENGLTDIEEIEDGQNQSKDEVYDLMGRLINLDPDQLPKGIYLINGKKTLIK